MPTRRSARLSGGSETFSPFLTNIRAEKASKTKSKNDGMLPLIMRCDYLLAGIIYRKSRWKSLERGVPRPRIF